MIGDDSASVSLAVTRAAIEVLFPRREAAPMSTQEWLDDWFPRGARAASRTGPATAERAETQAAPGPVPLPSMDLPPEPSPGVEDLSPEEITRRYELIDAWLAANDGSDDGIAGAAGSLVLANAQLAGLHGDPLGNSPLWGFRLHAAFADLGGHSMRALKGLDEGFSRL